MSEYEEVEQLEAPDGSMLITKTLVTEAAGYLHGAFGRVWPLLYPSIKQVAAATVLVRAMGYQQADASREVMRLRQNVFFVATADALVAGYDAARAEGLFR